MRCQQTQNHNWQDLQEPGHAHVKHFEQPRYPIVGVEATLLFDFQALAGQSGSI
jgi:hypothetical protein